MQEIETAPAESSTDSDRPTNGSYSHSFDDSAPPAVRARADVAADPNLSPGAKFFFGWLVDHSYLRRFGGDGFGRITIGQKDIRRLTHHDRKSITEWTQQLCDSRHIWIEQSHIPNAYPVNVYCIRALVPGRQQLEINGLAAAWGRTRGDRGKFSSRESSPLFSAENAQSASQGPNPPPPKGENLHLPRGENGTEYRENLHLAGGENGTWEAENFPTGGGKNGHGEAENFPVSGPKKSASEAEKTGHLMETPKEKGRKGDEEGGITAPQVQLSQAWLKKLGKMFPREIEAMKKRLVDRRKVLRADPDSFTPGAMKREVAELLQVRRNTIEKLQARGEKLTRDDAHRLKEYQAWISAVQDPAKDPGSYEQTIKPAVAAELAEIKAKLAAIEEALR